MLERMDYWTQKRTSVFHRRDLFLIAGRDSATIRAHRPPPAAARSAAGTDEVTARLVGKGGQGVCTSAVFPIELRADEHLRGGTPWCFPASWLQEPGALAVPFSALVKTAMTASTLASRA